MRWWWTGTALPTTLLLMCSSAAAQFGNIEVKWDSSGSGRPRVAEDRTIEFTAPEDVRRHGLAALPLDTLTEIVHSLGAKCETCTTRGHWVSRVRSACLEVCASSTAPEPIAHDGIPCTLNCGGLW